ncbi:MAG: hypothetical protein GVY25_00375 [Bacteroidetes bacterium]|jgi:hypothetical protein|nr:hypothetical protein [Bacteroidota bacterium]
MSQLRFTCRLFLILTVCVGMQGTVLVEALFLIHHDHIAEHHCINRNNPEVDCDGMCFLVERIEDVHGQHDHTSLTMRVPDIDLRAISRGLLPLPAVAEASTTYGMDPWQPASDPPPMDIFRPPWTS